MGTAAQVLWSGKCQDPSLPARASLPDSLGLVLCWCCAGHRRQGDAASSATKLCTFLHICA